jgi:hypothetical protein
MHELAQNGPDLGGVVMPTANAAAAKRAVRTADQNPSRFVTFRVKFVLSTPDVCFIFSHLLFELGSVPSVMSARTGFDQLHFAILSQFK